MVLAFKPGCTMRIAAHVVFVSSPTLHVVAHIKAAQDHGAGRCLTEFRTTVEDG